MHNNDFDILLRSVHYSDKLQTALRQTMLIQVYTNENDS